MPPAPVSRWWSAASTTSLRAACSRARSTASLRHGASDGDITVVKVPGSWEIPFVTERLAASGKYDAVVALGVLIRGATPHFDYIAAEAAKGLAHAAMATRVPVAFGVLTTDTLEQAIERAGSKAGNKGWQAAQAAIEMVQLYRALKD